VDKDILDLELELGDDTMDRSRWKAKDQGVLVRQLLVGDKGWV